MENSWKRIPLGKLIALQRGHDLPSQNRFDGQIPIMGSSGLTGWHNISKCAGPGVVIGRSGNSMGVVSYSEEDFWPLNTCLYVTDFKGNDERYIYYMLQQIDFDQFNSGSAQKSLNRNAIYPFEVNATTDTNEQKRIGKVLANFENKITLNRQINQTLEQMAQALFKSWFVDFDPVVDNALDAGFFEQDLEFSDELLRRAEARKAVRENADFKPLPEDVRQLFPAAFEECSEPSIGLGGWVPQGWESLPVGSLIDLIGGGTPKTSEHSYWGGDIPWFSVVDAPNDSDVFVLSTEKKITDLGVKNSSTKVMRIGTTIISARGTVGKCALVATPMAMNQSCYGVIGTNGTHDYFIYYLIRQSVSQLQQRSHGSVFSTITRDTFNSFKFAFSGELIANTFGETISPWFEKIRANNQQRYMLRSIRDTLLPKLISGELRLSDSEADTADEVLA